MKWKELRSVCGLEKIEISLADFAKEILIVPLIINPFVSR